MARSKVNVCGVPMALTYKTYGGGHIAPGFVGKYAMIGRARARKLMGGHRLPRAGRFVKLCSGWELHNEAGRFALYPR